MKRLLLILLGAVMAIGLSACGNGDEKAASEPGEKEVVEKVDDKLDEHHIQIAKDIMLAVDLRIITEEPSIRNLIKTISEKQDEVIADEKNSAIVELEGRITALLDELSNSDESVSSESYLEIRKDIAALIGHTTIISTNDRVAENLVKALDEYLDGGAVGFGIMPDVLSRQSDLFDEDDYSNDAFKVRVVMAALSMPVIYTSDHKDLLIGSRNTVAEIIGEEER